MLGLSGVDPAVRAETELAGHCAVDAVDFHLEATGDLFGRKARFFTLRLASRCVFAGCDQSRIDVTVIHGGSPQLTSAQSARAGCTLQPRMAARIKIARHTQLPTTTDARHMPLPASSLARSSALVKSPHQKRHEG